MKKLLILVAILSALALAFTSCGGGNNSGNGGSTNNGGENSGENSGNETDNNGGNENLGGDTENGGSDEVTYSQGLAFTSNATAPAMSVESELALIPML